MLCSLLLLKYPFLPALDIFLVIGSLSCRIGTLFVLATFCVLFTLLVRVFFAICAWTKVFSLSVIGARLAPFAPFICAAYLDYVSLHHVPALPVCPCPSVHVTLQALATWRHSASVSLLYLPALSCNQSTHAVSCYKLSFLRCYHLG